MSSPRTRCPSDGTNPEGDLAQVSLQAGASGYVSREGENLLFAITQVSRDLHLLGPDPLPNPLAPHQRLTAREFQVFLCLGRGQTVNQLVSLLGLRTDSIHALRRSVCLKTGLASTGDLIDVVG